MDEETRERLHSKRQNAAVKLAMDLEPYDPALGPDHIDAYIETTCHVLKQLTRKINKAAKNIQEVRSWDFDAQAEAEVDRIAGEDDDE